jgi:hypothetical protein
MWSWFSVPSPTTAGGSSCTSALPKNDGWTRVSGRCTLLVAGGWLLVVRCSLFVAGGWLLFVVQCSLFVARCSLLVARCSVFSVQCSVFSVQCSVFVVQCSVFVVQCLLFSVQCSVFVVVVRCCSLRVARCRQLTQPFFFPCLSLFRRSNRLFPTSLFLFDVHPRRTSRTRRALLVAGPSWCPHVVQCGAASGELLLLL